MTDFWLVGTTQQKFKSQRTCNTLFWCSVTFYVIYKKCHCHQTKDLLPDLSDLSPQALVRVDKNETSRMDTRLKDMPTVEDGGVSDDTVA